MSNNYIFKDLKTAVNNLEEVLSLKEKTEIIRDSAIKRFEICFDIAWKSIKNYAKSEGIECFSPRDCFRSAFQLKLIDNEDDWLNMVNDRNLTTHLYNEEQADKVYSKLSNYLELFKKLIKSMNQ